MPSPDLNVIVQNLGSKIRPAFHSIWLSRPNNVFINANLNECDIANLNIVSLNEQVKLQWLIAKLESECYWILNDI